MTTGHTSAQRGASPDPSKAAESEAAKDESAKPVTDPGSSDKAKAAATPDAGKGKGAAEPPVPAKKAASEAKVAEAKGVAATGGHKARAKPPAKPTATVFKLSRSHQGGVPHARPRRRHYLVGLSFLILVLLPAAVMAVYLYGFAADRYASVSAFSVHKEDNSGGAELLGGLSAIGVSTGTTPDADILYQFIQSQQLLKAVDDKIDLRATLGAHHDTDPVFSLARDADLEDMLDYWTRAVSLEYQPDTGIISLEVAAFKPEDARAINRVILDESSALINRLSKIARNDTISQAQDELDTASARLKETRLQMSKFREIEQIIDPTADFAGQMGVISALQESLAKAMIRRDLLIGTTGEDDPRMLQAEREIEAIRARIADERNKVGTEASDDPNRDPLSRVVGNYESLLVDREFAERSYLAARAGYDAAVAEARRKSRYLAVHIEPTLAETAIYPRRLTILLVGTIFLLMIWALVALTAYSIRDRR